MGSELQELPVTIQSCRIAYPTKPTPRFAIFLPNIDLTAVFMVDSVYFFSTGSQQALDLIFKALQETIITLHPFAGRLAFNQVSQRLELDANAAGVPFVDATSDLRIEDLGDLTLPTPLFRSLVFTPDSVRSFSDWPLVTVQVTRFKCGGFSLGLSVNHALSDGVSIIDFMQHFTATARGESRNPPLRPHFDRSMLKARSPPSPKIDFADAYYKSSEVPSTQSFTTVEDMLAVANLGNNFVVADLVSRCVRIPGSKIDYLKKLAMADGTINRCSTFDVLAAYIWKLRSVATEMPPDHESIMFIAVDVSSKTKPPLPQGFVGNRAFPVSVKMKTKDLVAEPLSHCLKLIRETLTAVDDEYVRSWLDWSEIHRGIPRFNGGFYVSSWWKFPFYDMDFGWGKPIYMGPVLTQRIEFVLILPVSPTRPEGGVDVLLTLEPQQMSKFQTLLDFPTM